MAKRCPFLKMTKTNHYNGECGKYSIAEDGFLQCIGSNCVAHSADGTCARLNNITNISDCVINDIHTNGPIRRALYRDLDSSCGE